MNKCFIIICFISTSVCAKFDFNYGGSVRTHPGLGGGLQSQLGYNIPLWGTPGNGVMYGLIRPNIEAGSSVVVSRFDSNLTVYPISFIGLGGGKQTLNSEFDEFVFYNCDTTRCKGRMDKVYTMGKVALGYGPIISSFMYRHFNNTYTDPEGTNLPVGEYQFALKVNPGEETQVQRNYFLGWKLSNATIGIVSNNVEFLESDKNYFLNLGIYKTKLSVFDAVFGAGTTSSSDIRPGGVVVITLTHQVSPSLALF